MGDLSVWGFSVSDNCEFGIIGDDTNEDQSFQIGVLCQDDVVSVPGTEQTTSTYGVQVGGSMPPMVSPGYTNNNFYGVSTGMASYNRSQTGIGLTLGANATEQDMTGAFLSLGRNVSGTGNIEGIAVGLLGGNKTLNGAINGLAIGASNSVNDPQDETTCSVEVGLVNFNEEEDFSMILDMSCPVVTDPVVSYFQSWFEGEEE